MSDYDVVVIGAGNGGQISAVTLAKQGLKVLLLERHNVPGGCATSFIRGRFEFEVALHQLSGLGTKEMPGPIRDIFDGVGVSDKLEFVQQENMYRFLIPDQLDITLKADRIEATEELQRQFPKEADNIDRFLDLVYEYCAQVVGVEFLGDPDASPEKYPLYFKYALKTTQDVFDEFFTDPDLTAAIGVYWCYAGVPPSKLPFNMMALMLWIYLEFKPWHLKGGSQTLSSALIDTFTELGGQVKFSCGAKEIKVVDNKVTSVVTDDGDEVTCDWVVSNAGTLGTYTKLIAPEHVPETTINKIGAKSLGISFASLYIALDCEPEEIGLKHATTFIAPHNDLEAGYENAKNLDNPELMLVSCYNIDDPDFSPKGTCQISVVTMAYSEPWLSIPPHEYADAKYRYSDGILESLDNIYPGLRDHIEEIEVSSPLTHTRYLGQPGGGAYAFEMHVKDAQMFVDLQSSIDGLFHAGSWTLGGGFQPTLMSGDQAAKGILSIIESQRS